MHGVWARTPVYFQSLTSTLASLYYILDMTSPLWQLRQSKQRGVVCEKWKQIFKFKSSHWNGIQETFEIRKYNFELIKEMLEIWSGQIQEYLNQHPRLHVQVHDHHYSPKMTPFITSQRFRAGRLVFSPKRTKPWKKLIKTVGTLPKFWVRYKK